MNSLKSHLVGFGLSAVLATVATVAPSVDIRAQGVPEPSPAPPKNVSVPTVRSFTLPNGLKVVVVRRVASPLVTVQMVIAGGASEERASDAGLAKLAAELLTKGTAKRSASEIAAAVEYLGGPHPVEVLLHPA